MKTSYPPSPALNVVSKLKGIDATAELIGRHRTTVNRWVLKGFLPWDVQQRIMALAREGLAPVTAEDFFTMPAPAEDAEAA